jgi:hypothetical protein
MEDIDHSKFEKSNWASAIMNDEEEEDINAQAAIDDPTDSKKRVILF